MEQGATIQGRKLVFPQKGQTEWETFTLPRHPGPSELLLKIRTMLFNVGTELAIYTGTHIRMGRPGAEWPAFPFYPRGSCVGEVIAVGEHVTGFAPGDRVLTGAYRGTYAVIDVSDGRAPLVLPEELSDDGALLATHSCLGLNAIRLAHMQLGESVGVFGQGLVGSSTLQYARIGGAGLIVAVDMVPYRLEVARSCGADITLNPREDDVEARIAEITKGKGLAVVVEASGNPQVIPVALRVAAELGRVVVVGSPRGTVEVDLYEQLHRKGISLIGAHSRTHPAQATPHTPWSNMANRQLALQFVMQGRLRVEGVISHFPGAEALGIHQFLVDHPEKYVGAALDWAE